MVQQTATTVKGEATRQRILEVAARAFMERGYSGTSLNEIIRESGVTKGGFYFHFDGKADVAIEALEMIRTDWRSQVVNTVGYRPRAVEQVAAMVRQIAVDKATAPSGAAMGRLCQELAEQPEVAERLRPFDAWFALTGDLFRRAQSQGDMDPDIDADAAARFAVTAYLGMDQLSDVSGDPDLVQRMVEDYLAFCFRAVGIHVPVPPARTT